MDQVKVKEELRRGLEAANQLRVLIAQSSQGKELGRNQTLMACITHQSSIILDTLDASISILRNCHANAKNRKRSYHNNRRNVDQQSPVKTIDAALTTEDGYSWRKYGQKTITKAKYPREYYRCGFKDHGCQATKRVQIISQNPTKYNITYYGQHTCQFLLNKHSQFHHLSACLENDFNSPYILSFEFSNAKHGLNQAQQNHRMIQQQHTSPVLLDHDHGCAMPLSPCDQSSSSIISDVMINDHLFSPPMLSVDNSKYHVMEDLYVDEFDGGVQDIQLWEGL